MHSVKSIEEASAKRRRTVNGKFAAPSTAPLPRKRFDPTVQITAASQMSMSYLNIH